MIWSKIITDPDEAHNTQFARPLPLGYSVGIAWGGLFIVMPRKLIDSQVLAIYERVKTGEPYSSIAKDFCISTRQVSSIAHCINHKHLRLQSIKTNKSCHLNIGKPLDERLNNGLKLNTETGCLEWQRYLQKDGYGVISATGWKPNTDLTHRVAWKLKHGEIPKGMCVLHKCDNPKCCNVDHLFLGSHALNMHDMKMKLRATRGEKKKTAKLTEQNVLEIVEMLKSGFAVREIAEMFHVTSSCISNISTGTTWWHVSGITPKPHLGSYLRPRFSEK